MNIYRKTALLHMIHLWVSCSINASISIIGTAVLKGKVTFDLIFALFLVGAVAVLSIVSRISIQMSRNDTSNGAQIFRYVCAFGGSSIIVYSTYTQTSYLLALIIAFLMILEIVVAILIPFRYRIINKFKKITNKFKE